MKKMTGYKSEAQNKNIAWFLPRPKPDHYKGGMPLYAEEWLLDLGMEMLGIYQNPKILNLFCGMNRSGYRVDIKQEVNPSVVYDAHEISHCIDVLQRAPFDIILADPPYSDEESKELYGTPKLNYKKWTAECDKVLKRDGLLIIYHKYIVPNPNPEKYKVVKRVFVGNRVWHLPRVAIYFKKLTY
uniref:Methyltransferase n=1 Tax=viral metagenome TaxID=1070528 RepID=A0A6M3LER2_9ZZZZ